MARGHTDFFGLGSLDYLTERWEKGDPFHSTMSEGRDFTESRAVPEEVFTSLVIGDLFFQPPRPRWITPLMRRMRPMVEAGSPVHFFRDPSLLPADIDCTGIAYSLALRGRVIGTNVATVAAKAVLLNTESQGILQVYFSPREGRDGLVDPVVCTNALYLLNQVGLAGAAVATENFVQRTLCDGGFEQGTRYYPSPDTFLYFVSRLITAFPIRYMHWTPALRAAIRQRQGSGSRPLELAQRILAATRLGVDAALDCWQLRKWQRPDGTFPPDALFKYGRSARYFGGQVVTTAFAGRALMEYGRALRHATHRVRAGIPSNAEPSLGRRGRPIGGPGAGRMGGC